MSRIRRQLSPLPLFDESSLLAALTNYEEAPIAAIHATKLWKALIKAELDEYHPGYVERMNSRMGTRMHSRLMTPRQQSRRGSLGAQTEEESFGPNPTSPSSTSTIVWNTMNKEKQEEIKEGNEEDEEKDEKEEEEKVNSAESTASLDEKKSLASEEDSTVGASSSSSVDPTTVELEHESEEARQKRFEFERSIRLKLEAEDDAALIGVTVFPLSRFNPSEEELADPNNPIHTRTIDPKLVPGLPQRMYPLLKEKFEYLTSRLQSHKTSADGSTTKLLIRLQDGQHIESVIMRHKQRDVATGRVEQRITLCVSSQVGCAQGCSFCSTGTMGMRGNLMMGEILEQLVIANRFAHIRNIVFMGMGEPLKNYDQVLSAIRAMTDGNRFGLAPSRITLSTVGIIPKMLELTRDIPSIQLALSLHAPTQELRQEIVPSAKSYPIEKLVEAMQYFIDRSKKRILVEYVLLDGVNASEKEAHQLGQLLKGMDVMINLIPYNSTSVGVEYHAPSRADSVRFQTILTDEYKLFTTIRVEMGADINGACGQLALENQNLAGIKPRGLIDDTATPDLEGMGLTKENGCATSGAGDIEDIGRMNRAKKPTATINKRRNGAANAADSLSPTSSPSCNSTSSATSSSSSSSSCRTDKDSTCDCETPAASAATSTPPNSSGSSTTDLQSSVANSNSPSPSLASTDKESVQHSQTMQASKPERQENFQLLIGLLAIIGAVIYMMMK